MKKIVKLGLCCVFMIVFAFDCYAGLRAIVEEYSRKSPQEQQRFAREMNQKSKKREIEKKEFVNSLRMSILRYSRNELERLEILRMLNDKDAPDVYELSIAIDGTDFMMDNFFNLKATKKCRDYKDGDKIIFLLGDGECNDSDAIIFNLRNRSMCEVKCIR